MIHVTMFEHQSPITAGEHKDRLQSVLNQLEDKGHEVISVVNSGYGWLDIVTRVKTSPYARTLRHATKIES